MLLAIDELKRSLTYHQKQLEENAQNIKRKQESIELLQTANEKHLEIIEQLTKAVSTLEKDIVPPMPIEKDSNPIIKDVS